MTTSNTPESRVAIVYKLPPEVFEAFAKKVGLIRVDPTTTAVEAAFQLGVQHVLTELRKGLTL